MPGKEPALRKRQQIAKANRMMFLWVAGASALVGVAAVASLFLIQTLTFNEKILAEKSNTVKALENNNKVAEELKSNIRVLETNQALIDAKAKSDDQALQVVLDALPADANSLALGASLQNRIFAGVNGLEIESIQVDPVAGVEVTADQATTTTGAAVTANTVAFRFTIKGSVDAFKEVLQKIERSIRPINLTKVSIEDQGSGTVLSVEGQAYYEPAKTIELKDKTVTP